MTKYSYLVLILYTSIYSMGCNFGFSDQDLNVVHYMGRYLKCQSLVFVEDREDLTWTKKIMNITEGNFYFSVLTSQLLNNIMGNNVSQLRFFRTKTLLAINEDVNLTALLNVTIVPHLLTWIMFGGYIEHEKSFYIPMSNDVFYVSSSSDAVVIKQVYHIKPGFGETVKTIWDWKQNDSKPPLAIDYKKDNFYNATMDMHYLFYKNICQEIHGKLMRIKIECHHQKILELIAKKLNFNLNGVECVEKEHPFAFPNGTDSEIFFKLKSREVDFSVVSHVVRAQNLATIDSIWPTFVLKSMMYLKRSRLAGHWTSYLRPLDSSIWWGILIWIFITGFLLLFSEKLLIRQIKWKKSVILEFVDSVLKSLQVFCNQAVVDIPTSISIRILYFLKLCVFVIFFQAYCGYLISSLMVASPHFPFTDLNGFFENKQYQLMTIRNGFERFYYRHVIGEGRRKDFMLPDDELPKSVQEGVDKLCSGSYLAFVDFRENLLDIDKIDCKITELPRPISNIYMAIASPKNSPYKEYVNRVLVYLDSAGITERMASHLYSHPDLHDKKNHDVYITVSMAEVFSVFVLLGLGIFLSIIILITEIIAAKKKKFKGLKSSKLFRIKDK